tara:strand:+ start:14136 stop:14516 length:381 start_codon:yes stop_codon:yes gene_type:complete
MRLKALLLGLAVFTLPASAQTVINFEDGSTFTLEAGQQIYISNEASTLFKRKLMNDKSTYFISQKPWASRDYVPEPIDSMTPGSHEWCVEYVPWSEGFTFGMQTFQRACDTNGDDVYDESDEGWEG